MRRVLGSSVTVAIRPRGDCAPGGRPPGHLSQMTVWLNLSVTLSAFCPRW